jgi:hypothetical protein
MHIILDSLSEFHDCGTKFILPHDMVRYVEFENTIAFLLKKNNFRHKIVGVRFSQEGGINHFLISWEFQIIDGLKEVHEIVLMERVKFNNKELIYCYGWGFDIGYYLDPDTGEVVDTEPIK